MNRCLMILERILAKLNIVKEMKKERGAIFVITALMLPVIFGFMGIGYDVGNLYMHKARLQNVADAAALAGGRAYLLSQKKTTGTKDTYDTSAGNRKPAETYAVGGNKTRSGNHPDADNAADDYIYKNIVNLGHDVKSDKYSHYALNSEGATPKTFYRVGLYEEVPLHFLPVILDKSTQKVRAGAIVLVEEGTTTSTSGDGATSTTTIPNPSVFDNLFTFSESLFTKNNIDADGNITQSFKGDIVYTHQNGTNSLDKSIYYDSSTVAPPGDGDATTTSQNHWYENKTNSATEKINDPIIDTTFDTTAYLEAFRQKLNSLHVDVNRSTSLRTSEINQTNGSLYYQELKIDGNSVCQKNNVLYIDAGNKDYYLVDKDTNTYLTVDGCRVFYKEFPRSYGNTSVRCYEKDGKYYILNSSNESSDCYIDVATNKAYKGDKELWIDNHKLYIPLDEWGNNKEYISESLYDCIDRNNYFNPQNDQKYLVKLDASTCNVFHITKYRSDGQQNQSFDIIIDEPITIGEETTPVYILVDGIYQVKIEGTAATTRRPIIFVFLDENTQQIKYEFTGAEFKGVIYAPISGFEHIQNLTGIFRGNIITKSINIEASSKMTWIQENFLENDDYTDAAIKAVSDANKQKIEEANAALTDELKQKIRERLGITEAQQNDMSWFNSLSYPEKQNFYTKWKSLYNEYIGNEAVRNILWPWNKHFDIQTGDGQSETTPDVLRLINFNTEYLSGLTKDPFIDLWLDD